MTRELSDAQKKYILEHYRNTSKSKLAKSLGVPKREIIKFLKKANTQKTRLEPSITSPGTANKFLPLIWVMIFIAVVDRCKLTALWVLALHKNLSIFNQKAAGLGLTFILEAQCSVCLGNSDASNKTQCNQTAGKAHVGLLK